MPIYEVKVRPCQFPCDMDTCKRPATPEQPNYLYEWGSYLTVYCRPCLELMIRTGNLLLQEERYLLRIEGEEPKQEPPPNDFGTPLAPRSEYRPGEQASYETAGQLLHGEVLHVTDGMGGKGQLYVIENPKQGFPDVVPAKELLEE